MRGSSCTGLLHETGARVIRARLYRHRHGLLALVCLGVAALLVLFARDVRAWQRTVARDDLRFRALPAHRSLWRPDTVLPGDPAGRALDVGQLVHYRRTLQNFWFSRVGSSSEARQDLPTVRAHAAEALQDLTGTLPHRADRSRLANLLGVLLVTGPVLPGDVKALARTLDTARSWFQLAIQLDPGNIDAKQNLELVLRLQKPGSSHAFRDARAGFGFGRGRAISPAGTGY
jgi:hypothetical protein